MYGMMQLQRKVKIEKFFGGANHKQTKAERELGVSNEELTYGKKGRPIVVTEVPEEFKMENGKLKMENEAGTANVQSPTVNLQSEKEEAK